MASKPTKARLTAQEAFDLAISQFGKAIIALDTAEDVNGQRTRNFCGSFLRHRIRAVRRASAEDWQRQLGLFMAHGMGNPERAMPATPSGGKWHYWEVAIDEPTQE